MNTGTKKKQDTLLRIDFQKTLSNEELFGSFIKKGPLPVVYYEGQYWVEKCNKPRLYATIKEVDEGKLSSNLIDRLEHLIGTRGVQIEAKNTSEDTTFLYSSSPYQFSLDLRVIAFSNDIDFAMRAEGRKNLDSIPYKGWFFTYMVPHIEAGFWVEAQGTARFQNRDANPSVLIEVLGILGYKTSR